MIALALICILLKLMVAYDHCSGGAPLIDGLIFPPIFLGLGASLFFRKFQIAASGFVVAIVAFALLIAAYRIAWWLGSRRRR
jgi:hypothetical protein